MITAEQRSYITLATFVVMPDHVHAIIVISNNDQTPGADDDNGTAWTTRAPSQQRLRGNTKRSPGAGVAAWKSTVSRAINQARDTPGTTVWQQGYYDRISRNDRELENVRRYIINNPSKHNTCRDDARVVPAGEQRGS